MKRRLILLLLSIAVLSCTFSACDQGQPPVPTQTTEITTESTEYNYAVAKDDVELKVWVNQQDKNILTEKIISFTEEYGETLYDISVEVVEDTEIVARYSEDPDSAADIIIFPNTLLNELVQIDALYEITVDKDIVLSENSAGAVESATWFDDKLYAFPLSVENGYYLFYDRRVIPDERIRTLEDLLLSAGENGKQFYMNTSSGFYLSSFFIGAGCELNISETGKQICDFNSETGIKVGEAIKSLISNEAFISGDEGVFLDGFGENIAVGIAGKWNAPIITEKLGSEYGTAKLPTFLIDDNQVQMSSFSSFMLVGVKSGTNSPIDAMLFAEWLSNEHSQISNFISNAKIPVNTFAAESPEVRSDINASALASQSQFSISRNRVLESFWGPSDSLGRSLEDMDNDTPVADLLNQMVEQVTQ